MARPLGPDTILLREPTIVVDSDDGTTYYEYSDGASIRNCYFQPFLMTEKFQEESTLERESSRTFFRVFVPWTSETEQILDTWRIVFEGTEYEVHAQEGRWRDFRGQKNHIAFLVKQRTG